MLGAPLSGSPAEPPAPLPFLFVHRKIALAGLQLQRQQQAAMDIGMVRIDPQRVAVLDDCFLDISLLEQNAGKIVRGLGVVRAEV